MGSSRKYERSIVKAKAAKENNNFETAWSDYREHKYVTKDEEGNVLVDKTPKNTQRKKQSHFDNKEQYVKMFAWAKSMKEQKEETK